MIDLDKAKPLKRETIDITPRWMGLFPMFRDWIWSGTDSQKEAVIEELEKLCNLADIINDAKKEGLLKGVIE